MEIKTIVDFLNKLVWNTPAIAPVTVVLLVGTGIFMTFKLGFVQFRYIKHAIKVTLGHYDNPEDEGDISHFQALSTALSATIGIGNIAGVATAIHYGGPGALFWMWVTGFFGTSLKFAECTLSQKFRKINPDGSASGGPMYYMQKALNWKVLAVMFAIGATVSSLGQGNSIQAFTIADQLHADFAIPQITTGIIITLLVSAVILGGIKRIAKVTQILAPAMTIIYLIAGIAILIVNYEKLPMAFTNIFKYAFSPPGMIGGFGGSFFMGTLIWGVKRGLFSNEAGQGSAAIAHSAAKTTEPVREGAVAMLGPYIDTIIICSITGLAILVTDAWTVQVAGKALNGSPLTAYAFEKGLPFLHGYGRYIITAAVLLFAISTIISWSYYGERSVQYLFGDKSIFIYRLFYVAIVFIGATSKLESVWGFGDFAIAFMTVPNLIALIALSGKVKSAKNDYFNKVYQSEVVK